MQGIRSAPILVLGRFPPPIDGQTLATERLADLLTAHTEAYRVHTGPRSGEISNAERWMHYLRLRRRLKKTLRDYPKATILWNSISPDSAGHFRDILITLPAARKDQRIFAVLHRGTFSKLFTSPLTAITARRLLARVEGFVFPTEGLANQCASWIPSAKRFVILNEIDSEIVFSQQDIKAKQQDRRKRDKLNILFAGHMIPAKGYLQTLEAVRLLTHRSIPVEAHFAGGWTNRKDKEAFAGLIATHKLDRVVFHHGLVSDRRRMRTLYQNADVLVLPSVTEAQCLVVSEALNAGMPIVATLVGAIPEMVHDEKEGYLLPSQNSIAIADAVEKLCDMERWLRMSIMARQRYEDMFSIENIRDKWLKLLM